MKGKLTALILEAPKTPCIHGGQASGRTFQTAENLAEYLLANGATIPLCCKDCALWEKIEGDVAERGTCWNPKFRTWCPDPHGEKFYRPLTPATYFCAGAKPKEPASDNAEE